MRSTALLLGLLVLGCKGERGDPGPPGPPVDATDTGTQVLQKLNRAVAAGGSLDLQRTAISVTVGPESFDAPANWATKVPYSDVAYDKLHEFNPSGSYFVASHAGEYLVCASLSAMGRSVTYGWGLELVINKADGISKPRIDLFEDALDQVKAGCCIAHLDALDGVQINAIYESPYKGTYVDLIRSNASWLTIHRID